MTLTGNISGLEGSMITYYCEWSTGMPTKHMVAICLSNGSWSPNPRDLECHLITSEIEFPSVMTYMTPTTTVINSNATDVSTNAGMNYNHV